MANFIVTYAIEKVLVPCITDKYNKIRYKRLHKKIVKQKVPYDLNQLYKIRGAKK